MKGASMLRTPTLAAVAAAALALSATAFASSRTIAVVTHGGFRAVVTAHKTSGGRAPTASVTATGYRAANHVWHRARTLRLSGTFFWKTLTAPHAVCRLELRGSRLTLSVLVSPSLGCSTASTLTLG
jgi:hypothetical protein